MSILINPLKCIACKRCINVCPGSLIKLSDEHKAYIKYPKDCWGCVSCVKECPVNAIDFYLGADMGGMGSKMNVNKKGQYIYWTITKSSGEVQTIEINTKESNKY